jgi:hypothetical protein
MENIYLLLGLFLIIWYFITMRKITENAHRFALQYCQQQGIQFIALSRQKTRLSFSKKLGLYWKTQFVLEFSGDRESSYQGTLIFNNQQCVDIIMPPFRINETLL